MANLSHDRWAMPITSTDESPQLTSSPAGHQILRGEQSKGTDHYQAENTEELNGSWSNPAFNHDEYDVKRANESYQIPRVDLNKIIHPSYNSQKRDSETSQERTFENIQLQSPDGKSVHDRRFSFPEGENGSPTPKDYSLLSYFNSSKDNPFLNLFKSPKCLLYLKKLFVCVLVLLYFAYFITALVLPSRIEDYWCHGEGFLIIITAIGSLILLYSMVTKSLMWKKIRGIIKFPKQTSKFKSKYVNIGFNILLLLALIVFLAIDTASERSRLISVFGIFVLILFGFLFSKAPRKVIWRQVIWGLGLQFVMGLIILRWSMGRAVFSCLGDKVSRFLLFTDDGSKFVYGKIVSELEVFAFKILSVILFFSFCIQILYYYGIMQWIVIKLGWCLQITVGTTACESVNAAANIFLGQSEAPLLIKPFLPKMTKSELHAVMTGGFATIAGSVLAAYISFGVDPAHLLSASVMSAPAALGFAKLFYPETEESNTRAKDIKVVKGTESNVLHAACEGVVTAIPLVANITANLLAFIAFIAFVDSILNWACILVNVDNGVCSLSNIFGYVFMPLAWIMGVPWQDCYIVGQLIGTKTMVNEFVGYLKLTEYIKSEMITKRSEIIATYALCGFSNISGIGIQLGALGGMAPERRGDLAQIAFRAMIAGSVACFLTACVAGSLISTDGLEPLENEIMDQVNAITNLTSVI